MSCYRHPEKWCSRLPRLMTCRTQAFQRLVLEIELYSWVTPGTNLELYKKRTKLSEVRRLAQLSSFEWVWSSNTFCPSSLWQIGRLTVVSGRGTNVNLQTSNATNLTVAWFQPISSSRNLTDNFKICLTMNIKPR